MTLSEYLAAGYQHARGNAPDPARACADEIPRADLDAELKRLAPPLDRDHISRVKADFIRGVMAL